MPPKGVGFPDPLSGTLKTFHEELLGDGLAAKRVEVGIVTFGPVRTELEFTGAANFFPPELQSSGNTPMGEAIERGLEMLRQRKEQAPEVFVPALAAWPSARLGSAPTATLTQASRPGLN